MERLSKKEKGLMDLDSSVVVAGAVGYRGLNRNVKKTIKAKLKREINALRLIKGVIIFVLFLYSRILR